jgi:hypothetical protein
MSCGSLVGFSSGYNCRLLCGWQEATHMLGLGQRIEHWVGPNYTLIYLAVDRDWGPAHPLLVPSIVYRCPKNTIA